jgi:hypothetical protein
LRAYKEPLVRRSAQPRPALDGHVSGRQDLPVVALAESGMTDRRRELRSIVDETVTID